MRRKDLSIGLILILVGIAALLDYFFNMRLLSISRLWPLFLLTPGLTMELSFVRSRKGPGILIPGGILTTLGFLFLFETYTNWHFAAYTWPVYPLAVAIGLWQFYMFSGKPRPLLIPIIILCSVSLISFSNMFLEVTFRGLNRKVLAAAALILVGVVYFLRGLSNKTKDSNNTGAM